MPASQTFLPSASQCVELFGLAGLWSSRLLLPLAAEYLRAFVLVSAHRLLGLQSCRDGYLLPFCLATDYRYDGNKFRNESYEEALLKCKIECLVVLLLRAQVVPR